MTRHKHRKPLIKLRSLYLWHRYVGVNAALFVLVLAITGLFLNHTEQLELDSNYISDTWLLDWYDIEPPQRIINYSAGQHTVTLVEDRLYINTRAVPGHYESLAGAILSDGIIVVAADAYVMLFTQSGELVESLSSVNGKRDVIGAIGKYGDTTFVLDTGTLMVTDIDFSDWQQLRLKDRHTVKWSAPDSLPVKRHQQLVHHYRGSTLTLERVILDLHSGRILGNVGVFIMDLAAILLCLLSLSGLWIWIQQRRKHQQRRQQ